MSDVENNRPVLPSKHTELVAFFDAHIPVWEGAPPAAIGLTPDKIAALKTANDEAKSALALQESTKTAARAATTGVKNKVSTLRDLGGDGVRDIKAFAASTNDPNVFQIAEIPAPAPRKPVPPPSQPTGFKVELTVEGGVKLSWKSTGSSGGYYTIRRKLQGESAFTLIGNASKKFYIDSTLSQGTTSATYIVQGWRGPVPGDQSLQYTVQFGVGGGGGTVASVKLAA